MNTETLERICKTAMRTAIRKHPKAKLWATANHVDNFALVMRKTAEDALMDIACNHLDDTNISNWLNEMCKNDCAKMHKFGLEISREMWSELRA